VLTILPGCATIDPGKSKHKKTVLELCDLAQGQTMETQTLKIQKTVFDLDSKDDVTVIKEVTFTPVDSTQAALTIVGHDAKKFLEIINAGLRDYTRDQATTDNSIPWMQEDEEGNKTPFSGTMLTEEKSKQLASNVLNMAKLLFGYAKDMLGGRDAKKAAKAKSLDMLLSNPQVVEALKG